VLYWDETGFALWQKRLEKETFKWPKQGEHIISLSHEQWLWLLRGFNIANLKPHQRLSFSNVN
jgi:transposase